MHVDAGRDFGIDAWTWDNAVTGVARDSGVVRSSDTASSWASSWAASSWAVRFMLAGGAAVTVWAVYHPADSTAVEQGDALGLTLAVMLWAVAAAMVGRITPSRSWRQASWWCDVAAMGLAAWVFLSAWVHAGTFSSETPSLGGDLRSATNEAWWWIAAAGFFVIARRLMSLTVHVRAMFGLLLGLGVLLAVHTLHQQYISLPQTMREYQSDPDGMLAKIGMQAPAGSAARMMFENRMRDGGPTATFALANSLAGPLAMILTLGGGCLVCWLPRWKPVSSVTTKPSLGLFFVVGGACVALLWALLMTNSRSGFLSVLIVASGGGLWHCYQRFAWVRNRGFIGIVLMIGLAGVAMIYRMLRSGDDAGAAVGAGATIALRLQYWRSTLAMAGDDPWFGAGPGNFQAVYQTYREMGAHELIAEPHNFVMETLACGGWVGVVLLCVCMIAGCLVWYRSREGGYQKDEPEISDDSLLIGKQWLANVLVGSGAFVGLLSVWYVGIFTNTLPDFEAHLIAVPIAVAVMATWMIAWRAMPEWLTPKQCRGIALAATATGLIHLCFSGGWTVPGVSVVLLWLASVAACSPVDAPEETTSRSRSLRVRRLVVGIVGVSGLLGMFSYSWRPVSLSRELMAEAAVRMQTNRVNQAVESLRQAMAVDPLNRDAPIWMATISNQAIMQSMVTNASRLTEQLADADAVFNVAVERTGNDPVRLRAISELLVQRYQVGGRVEDLTSANALISRARELSPMHETITAQEAEIVRELSERGMATAGITAATLAIRAEMLANAGGAVVTRKLELQPILAARVVGNRAVEAPVSMAASGVLSLIP